MPSTGRADTAVIRAGFMPLTDCAVLVAAARKGFAAREGLVIDLVRQTSWASIRDRLAVGQIDVAQMLAPMPIASTFGLGGLTVPMIVPMALGLGGNAITVSTGFWDGMAAEGAELGSGPVRLGAALKQAIDRRPGHPPTFAMVHPFSAHNYELRYFLAAAGLDPDRDVRLVVVPPPYMVEAIESGQIDGFCVGEPWNSLAVDGRAGVLMLPKAEIWRSSPCKVLGMRADYADRYPGRVSALVRALEQAARWADDPANRAELAALLSDPGLIGVAPAVVERGLSGHLIEQAGRPARTIDPFLTFHRGAATFPWRSHGLWFYSQMVRWGQVEASAEREEAAAAVYRPDLYRAALSGTGAALPPASSKVEGAIGSTLTMETNGKRLDLAPDRFFDGRVFDPEDVAGYLAGFDRLA